MTEQMTPDELLAADSPILDALNEAEEALQGSPHLARRLREATVDVLALIAERDALRELASASQVLIEEWDRNDANKFDIMPAKDWEKAEARFRAAIKSARAEGGSHG